MLVKTLIGPADSGVLPGPSIFSGTMPEPGSSSTGPTKRACDACHRRKIKCIGDGNRPCKNCSSSGLTCTYNAIPQKKGPKGSRAKVISELRETQRQSQLTAAQINDIQAHSPRFVPRNLLTLDMITACVDYYFANVYPTQPILQRIKVGETIGQMGSNVEAYCLVMSLCGYMLIQPNMSVPLNASEGLDIVPQSSYQLGQILVQETLRARKSYEYVENPTIWTVITSFFLFGSHFCLDKHNTAWFHLRESTTLAQLLGMHDEMHYQIPDVTESSRRRRLYWLLFVTERAYALQKHRPLTLQATINLPTLEEDPAEAVELNGFLQLVRLYRPFDETFVGLWNKAKNGCTTHFLAQLQQQLTEALPVYLQCTETQAVDLRCSQQWLRTMVWQLSISHGFLSSAAAESAMTFTFPVEVSRDLMTSASHFSQQAMEVHGIGLIEKLFDVACTLMDVMSCVPYNAAGHEYGPREYLDQMMRLISTLRGGQQRYMPLLLAKMSETMPSMPVPAYAMPPSIPRGTGFDDPYDGSQAHSSGPNSSEHSPHESPIGGPPEFGFQELSGYFGAPAAGLQYADLTSAGPAQGFPDVGIREYPGAQNQMKFEGPG